MEHLPHDRRLRLEDLVARRLPVGLADVAIPVRSARQHIHHAAAGTVPLTPSRALADLGFLVLGDHSLELHQEDLFGSFDPGRPHEHHFDSSPGELLEQQDLIGILAAEPIRAVHEEGIDLPLRRQIAHTLQAWTDERRAAPAIILVNPVVLPRFD